MMCVKMDGAVMKDDLSNCFRTRPKNMYFPQSSCTSPEYMVSIHSSGLQFLEPICFAIDWRELSSVLWILVDVYY